MRSSEGLYFQKLDHVRALAAYLVFMWHAIHPPVAYAAAVPPGLALLDEGHVGVGLFMVLSGYLFTKIIGDRSLNLPAFVWNRFIRLVPLLVAFLAMWWVSFRGSFLELTPQHLWWGLVLPTWPGGAWSIATEFHFYALFPLLLWAERRFGNWVLLAAIVAAIALRAFLFLRFGSAEDLAYWTIVGRFDQFALGILAARVRTSAVQRRAAALVLFGGFLIYMEFFDRIGGFHATEHSALWIVHTTIEGAAFAALIVWYDQTRFELPSLIAKPLAAIGCWSYSIYMWEFFARLCVRSYLHMGPPQQVAVVPVMLIATLAFGGMALIGWLSYTLIETPSLRFRIPYLRDRKTAATPSPINSPA